MTTVSTQLKLISADVKDFYYVVDNNKTIGIIKWRSEYYSIQNHFSELTDLLEIFAELGSVDIFWNAVNSVWNCGNGWEWTESVHKVAKEYSIVSSVTWYTTITKSELGVDSFCKQQNINVDYRGIKISLRHSNNQPSDLCYFFRVDQNLKLAYNN